MCGIHAALAVPSYFAANCVFFDAITRFCLSTCARTVAPPVRFAMCVKAVHVQRIHDFRNEIGQMALRQPVTRRRYPLCSSPILPFVRNVGKSFAYPMGIYFRRSQYLPNPPFRDGCAKNG